MKNDFGFGGRNFQQPQQTNSFPVDPAAIQSFAAVPAVPPLEDNSIVPPFGNQLTSRNPVSLQTSQEHTQIDPPFGSNSISRPAVSDINSFQPLNNGGGSRNFQQLQQPNSISMDPPAIQSLTTIPVVPPLEDDLVVPTFGFPVLPKQNDPAFESNSIPRPAVPDTNFFQSMPSRSNFR